MMLMAVAIIVIGIVRASVGRRVAADRSVIFIYKTSGIVCCDEAIEMYLSGKFRAFGI